MIYEKYLIFGLSGIGITGSGLTIWQLTKEIKHKKQNSQIPRNNIQERSLWEKEEVKEECGNDVWAQSSLDENKTNNKGINWDGYKACLIKHLTSKK